MKVLGIDRDVMLDASKIKIIDSIAGAGKSSLIDAFLKQEGIDYLRLTSTHALKRDALRRFGGNVKTIAAGLFDNSEGFYAEERDDIPFKVIVIDEILQVGVPAIKWAMHHVGQYNIIITTDSHQMLAPEDEYETEQAFESLTSAPFSVVSNISKTLRAQDDKTRKVFELFYAQTDGKYHPEELPFPTIHFDPCILNPLDTYITHTNEIENYIYKVADVRDFPLIPKGRIAGVSNPNPLNYAVLPELVAKRKYIDSYFQCSNIATPTRYQGQEVEPDRNLYYLVEAYSSITARELYTVATRCKCIDSLTIAVVDFEHTQTIKAENGNPLVPGVMPVYNEITESAVLTNTPASDRLIKLSKEHPQTPYILGYEVEKKGSEMRLYACSSQVIPFQFKPYEQTPEGLKPYNGPINKSGKALSWIAPVETAKKRSIVSTKVKKDEASQFDYMPQVEAIIHRLTGTYSIQQPRVIRGTASSYTELYNADGEPLTKLDLFSAFGTVGANTDMPSAGLIYTTESPDLLNFYIYNGDFDEKKGGIRTGSLVTGALVDYINSTEPNSLTYAFSTEKRKSALVFDYAYKTARTGTKGKKRVSQMRWGYLERPYITYRDVILNGEIHEHYPLLNTNATYQLMFCALQSHISAIMLKARDSVGNGEIYTDALLYYGADFPEMPDFAQYRIEDKTKPNTSGKKYDNILFKNYDDPVSVDSAKRKARRQKAKAKEEAKKPEAKHTDAPKPAEIHKNILAKHAENLLTF